jgi:PAS domain S-box-containing protein
VHAQAPQIPIIVLTGLDNEMLAMEALRMGAQDYLVKGQFDILLLGHLIRYAIERYENPEQLRHTEGALALSEARFHNMIEKDADGILIVDSNGVVRFANPAAEVLFSCKAEEFLGRLFGFPVVSGETIELDIVHGEAGKIIVEMRVVEMDWEGERAYLASLRDITEHKRTVEVLRESEERYRTILKNIEDGYFEVDIAGNFTFFNDSLCGILGYSRDEMMGMNNRQYTDEENARKLYQAFNKVYRTGEPTKEFNWEIIRKDGAKRYIETSVSLIKNSSGQPIGFRGVVRDITERMRAEEALRTSQERFRQLFDGAPIGYHEIDSEGRFTRVNRTESEMLGYTVEEMLGQPAWNFIVEEEESRKAVAAKLAGVVLPYKGLERTYRRKDGTTFPVIIEDLLLRDSEGRIIGIRSTIQDITERKRAEEEMAALQEQLRQSQKMEAIGRLAGGIAHDFNNFLTVIKGYSQLSLLELKEDSPLKGNIGEINRATDQSADLIRQLLAFSRRQVMEMRVLDLNILLQNLNKMLRRVIGEDIELVTLFAEDLGRVKTDPGQIEQVILNLAVNARDAMPSGGKLTIETANVELDGAYARRHVAVTPGRYVMLAVSDTGVGMTPEVRDRVFEPFFTTKEEGKGTGLGLSTVYGIVKQSEGNIWIYSEPGHGTTFKIYLPQVEELWEEVKEKVVEKELPRGSETVLVVEDEQEVRKLAVRVLKMQGYKVLEASQGDDALRLCEEHNRPIQLMVTDVVMPGMDGRELTNRLMLLHPEIRVLYMSGYTDNIIVHHGILERGINYIQKPFTVGALAGKVREVLDNKNLSVKSPFAKGDLGGFDQG